MDETEYRAALAEVLGDHREAAAQRLRQILDRLPSATESVEIVVFPDQDGEGTFTVRVTLAGPDLYVLNRAIDEWAVLFDVRHTEKGLDPPVPLMDPFDEDFVVNDAVVDSAAKWIRTVWNALGPVSASVPVTVIGYDGHGTITPLGLSQ